MTRANDTHANNIGLLPLYKENIFRVENGITRTLEYSNYSHHVEAKRKLTTILLMSRSPTDLVVRN